MNSLSYPHQISKFKKKIKREAWWLSDRNTVALYSIKNTQKRTYSPLVQQFSKLWNFDCNGCIPLITLLFSYFLNVKNTYFYVYFYKFKLLWFAVVYSIVKFISCNLTHCMSESFPPWMLGHILVPRFISPAPSLGSGATLYEAFNILALQFFTRHMKPFWDWYELSSHLPQSF